MVPVKPDFSRSLIAGDDRIFLFGKCAEMNIGAITFYVCHPFSLGTVEAYANKAASIF